MKISNTFHWPPFFQMFHYAQTHLREISSAEDLCAVSGYSRWYINRLFSEATGLPPGRFLTHLKMNAAEEDLREGKTVAETAERYGYESVKGFVKAFTKDRGISPSKFRRAPTPKTDFVFFTCNSEDWHIGCNPSPDGRWMFEYSDLDLKNYLPMVWNTEELYFEAPFQQASASDPYWYCRGRDFGFGIHPGQLCAAAKTFLCPYDGRVKATIHLQRNHRRIRDFKPIRFRILLNETPIYPTEGFFSIDDAEAHSFELETNVKKGDKIRITVSTGGDSRAAGIYLFREEYEYLK